MFVLAHKGLVWTRVELLDCDEDGNVVPVSVRLLLRPWTRAELRARQSADMQARLLPVQDALARLGGSEEPEAIRQASDDLRAALQAAEAAAAADDAEVAERLVGWNAADIGGEAFDTELRDALLADQSRFVAVRNALLALSRDGLRKNSSPGSGGQPARTRGGAVNGSGTQTDASPE